MKIKGNKSHRLILVFFIFLSYASPAQFTSDSLLNIETSTDAKFNISRLTAALKTDIQDTNLWLSTVQLLVQNYSNENQHDKATLVCQDALLKARKNKNTYAEACLYQSLGKIHYYLKLPAKVQHFSLECIKIAEKYNYYLPLMRAYHNLGVIELEKERLEPALNYFTKSIGFGEKLPQTSKSNLARNYRLLGSTYDSKKDFKKADSAFSKALAIYSAFKDSLGLVEVQIFMARRFLAQHQIKQADSIITKVVALARHLGKDEYTQAALASQVDILAAAGNYKEALVLMQEVQNIEAHKNEKLLNKELAAAETKFKIKEIENKESLRVAEANRRSQLYIFVAGILLLVSLAGVVFIYQRRLARKERNYLQQLYESQEKERTRISKDLHDNMGAYTTSLLAQIDTIENTNNNQTALHNLRHDAENIMATLRETIWILKSGAISIFQFKDLLYQYAHKHLSTNAGIAVSFDEQLKNNLVLSPGTSLNLYRIYQEILQNIIKHSKASAVTVQLSCENTHFSWTITDNGTGFDVVTDGSTSGLENMRYRAKEIACELTITSSEKGTRIHLEGNL